MAIIPLNEPTRARPQPRGGTAILALGFRPFYLLAALFAAFAVPWWIAILAGAAAPPAHLPGLLWHAHEMVFGFACAVIVGFLFTAGRNWTGLPTPAGAPLAGLVMLWLLGRVLMASGPASAAAAVDVAFLPIAALLLGRVLYRAGSARNYFVVVMLMALALANLTFHLRVLGMRPGDPVTPLLVALALITMLETIIAGRIVPNFTANGLRGVRQYQHEQINYTAIGFTGCALLLWLADANAQVAAATALIAAALQGVRLWGWNPWATRRTPLLWILHLSHAWIPLSLILIALAELGLASRIAAIHGLAIGAMAGLIMGMITRTALGHTGRMLVAGRIETAAYLLIHVAVLARVLPLTLLPDAYTAGMHLAAGAWSLAFVLYLVKYAPMLWRPRVDGKEG